MGSVATSGQMIAGFAKLFVPAMGIILVPDARDTGIS